MTASDKFKRETSVSRPLMNNSVSDLVAMAERNKKEAAELKLIRSELAHRKTAAAAKLKANVEKWISASEIAAQPKSSSAKSTSATLMESTASTQADLAPPMSDTVRNWTNEAVAKLRAKLIDLSRRSPLIDFKHASRSASQLRVVDERPDLLWQALGEGSLGFEPLPGEDQTPPDELTPQFRIAYERARLTDEAFQKATEALGDNEADARPWQEAERELRGFVRELLGLPKLTYGKTVDVASIARAHGFDPSFELKFSDDEGLAAHHQDNAIRVLLMQKELDKRLKTIWERAGTHLRETGLHTLHLVFGFVQWFEDDASDIPMHAPLLLLPVGLNREVKKGRFEYTLHATGDELEVNIALIEKARTHWGLQLPEMREEEAPESYFIRIKAVLEKGLRLKLNNFVTLAVLPPMVLWKDLDPALWPEDAFSRHRLLPGMLGATEIPQASGEDGPCDIDDPVNADQVPALITDADASQHHAIMDMAAGHDMAIEGPPGTGKSQTITNMIATALAQGQRVLFVAEKQAALRVVADRLRTAGFGPLLLELHGDRAVRADVYDGIRERLGCTIGSNAKALEDKRTELWRHRNLLRRYLGLVRTELGALQRTAHDLAWREVRLRDQFDREQIVEMEELWQPEFVNEIDAATLNENRELLEQFGQALVNLDAEAEERTRWAYVEKIGAFDQTNELNAARKVAEAARQVDAVAQRLSTFKLSLPTADQDWRAMSKTLLDFVPFSTTDEAIVASALHAGDTAAELLESQSSWRASKALLEQKVRTPDAVLPSVASDFADTLAITNCPPSLASAKSALSAFEDLCQSFESSARDLDFVVQNLLEREQTALESCCAAALAIGRLDDLGATSQALIGRDLADPAALAVATNAETEAEGLRAERASVLGFASGDALKLSSLELDGIADTLETTGFLGRLGGSYRASWRQALRLLTAPANRLEAGAQLHKIATFLRDAQTFEDKSKARHLVPALLWDGIDSDFASLKAVCEALAQAAATLGRIGEISLLNSWLSTDIAGRQRFGSSFAKSVTVLTAAVELGLGHLPIEKAKSFSITRRDELRRLVELAQEVGALEDAGFFSASGSIAESLIALHGLRETFGELCASNIFAWITGVEMDLQALDQTLDEIGDLETSEAGSLLLDALAESKNPVALMNDIVTFAPKVERALDQWTSAADHFEGLTDVTPTYLSAGDDKWMGVASLLEVMADDRKGASLAAELVKYRTALADREIVEFADAAIDDLVEPTKLADLFELIVTSALLQAYLGTDGEELSRLGSLSLEAARQAFRKTDKELHKLEAHAILAKRLEDQVPKGISYGRRSDFSDLGLIMNEVALTRPRTPLRDVVHRAGNALQALKPVWMMSPTSVAQFIRPGELMFDLLIVDEASQMRPEYSVSCMLRADQFVVVGDANQLPPSDHFQVAATVDDDDDEAVGVDDSTESILDLANQRFYKKPRLKWHYRSQHESLIQFSNRQFYESDLVVFPSPNANEDDLLGVKCTYVPGKYPDTQYEASINQREAEEVIEQAFGLMQRYPERSIGIVAMNAKQTELIRNEFDRLIVEEDRVRKYVEAYQGSVDEFFIKNLENVQGDERDIILISTVYGPGKEGKVRQNFGPMNREVGWRRLNVLVTRAKMSCRLVTSLRPEDVKVTETSSAGLVAFKSYLTYAHGGATYDDASGGETDSDFEIFVADAIRDAGYEVVYQVGVEKFRIDLGIRHNSCPIGFIAGVECDGASYHSGYTVRDRDHIRQTVLEGLGWKIYRVWSTDWFADPNREKAKLIAWLDRIREHTLAQLAAEPAKVSAIMKKPKTVDMPVALEPPQAEPAQVPTPPLVSVEAEKPEQGAPREPKGRALRALDDMQPYEAIRGSLYEIWRGDTFLGEVGVVKRAVSNPRIYGDRVVTAQSEYEGRVESTGDAFISFDLYAAMREVAARAKEAELDR